MISWESFKDCNSVFSFHWMTKNTFINVCEDRRASRFELLGQIKTTNVFHHPVTAKI